MITCTLLHYNTSEQVTECIYTVQFMVTTTIAFISLTHISGFLTYAGWLGQHWMAVVYCMYIRAKKHNSPNQMCAVGQKHGDTSSGPRAVLATGCVHSLLFIIWQS